MSKKSRGGIVLRRRAAFAVILAAGTLSVLLFGCRDELTTELDTNLLPDTYLTGAPAESTTTFYRVHLYWYGNDTDGKVVGYEFAITDSFPADEDTITYSYTERTDSLFLFPVTQGQQVLGHRFYIRAVDNDGGVDPEPAQTFFGAIDLIPPVVEFTVAEAYHPDYDSTYTLTSTNPSVPTDTVDAGWNVRFHWEGVDADRMIDEFGDTISVGQILQYEYWLAPWDPSPTTAGIGDTVMAYENLSSGKYRFSVRAMDDAGFTGLDPAVRTFVWNRDPDTEFVRAFNENTGKEEIVFKALSAGWADTLTFFEGDTVPLGTDPTSVHEVTLYVGLRGSDPDDILGAGVSRFQYRLGANRWAPIDTLLGNFVELAELKTTNAILYARCADGFGRTDGSPASVSIFVNRAPVMLVDTLDVAGGIPIPLRPYPNSVVPADSIAAWGDSLAVRVRATDPDSTTGNFWYSFRYSGALFRGKNVESLSGIYETKIAYPPSQVPYLDTLEVLIQEDAKNDELVRASIYRIPFRVE